MSISPDPLLEKDVSVNMGLFFNILFIIIIGNSKLAIGQLGVGCREWDFFLLQQEEGARTSYTGRNKHLEAPHILSACYWVFPESSAISNWKHLKTCQGQPQVTYPLPFSVTGLFSWHLRAGTDLGLLTQHFCTPTGSVPRRTGGVLTIGKLSFQWLIGCYWQNKYARVFLALGWTDWKGQKTLLWFPKHVD